MKILILGGASGLGKSITLKLSNQADNIVYFTFAKSDSNALKIEKEHPNSHALNCDFKIESSIQELIEKISSIEFDCLVINAYSGEFLKSHFHKINPSDFKSDFETNIVPIIKITQELIKKFRKQKKGKIITILTSALHQKAQIGASVYLANKAFLEQLAKSWASENISFNITSNTISPSFMLTNMTNSIDERMVENITINHPLKKLLTTEEVADTVLFLTKASTHINGIDIPMNAGI